MVVYKPKKISEDRIQQLVAMPVTTPISTATDEAYNGLEACCLSHGVSGLFGPEEAICSGPRRRPSLISLNC